MNIDELRAANRKSAETHKWGVLPAGDYVGVDDPMLIGDIPEARLVVGGDLRAPQVVDAPLIAAVKEFQKLDTDEQKRRLMGLASARRFLRNLDLEPAKTNTLNLVVAGVGAAGGGAAAALLKPKKGRK